MRSLIKEEPMDNWLCQSNLKSSLIDPTAEEPLRSWYREVEREDWATPANVKEKYRSASIVGNRRIVFNVRGNQFRLVVLVNYQSRIVYVRFIGTHAAYDNIDIKAV